MTEPVKGPASYFPSIEKKYGQPIEHWKELIRSSPLTRPALVTVTIYSALGIWNGFLLPLVLTQSPDQRTMPLALWTFQGQFGVNVPAVTASVTLTTIPIVVMYVIGRRQLLSGLTAGFGK